MNKLLRPRSYHNNDSPHLYFFGRMKAHNFEIVQYYGDKKTNIMKCFLAFLSSIIVLCPFQSSFCQSTSSTPGCPSGSEEKGPVNATYEHRVVELLNNERADNDLPPLKKSDDLFNAARFHAWDMCKVGYFTHDSRNSNDEVTCETGDRISSFYNWNTYRENIGTGYTSPKQANNGWINSKPHYENMLAENVKEIGVGYHDNCKNRGERWVENFGRRAGVYPVVINKEMYSTTDRNVDLYIYGKEDFDEIRIKNKGDDQWSEWTSFKANYDNWKLTSGEGFKTVQVEMRNSSQTIQSSDKIYLGEDAPISVEANEISKQPTVSIYPNPVLDNTTRIKLNPHENAQYHVMVVNQLGQEVKQVLKGQLSRKSEKTLKVNTSELSSGVYFVKVRNNGSGKPKIQQLLVR